MYNCLHKIGNLYYPSNPLSFTPKTTHQYTAGTLRLLRPLPNPAPAEHTLEPQQPSCATLFGRRDRSVCYTYPFAQAGERCLCKWQSEVQCDQDSEDGSEVIWTSTQNLHNLSTPNRFNPQAAHFLFTTIAVYHNHAYNQRIEDGLVCPLFVHLLALCIPASRLEPHILLSYVGRCCAMFLASTEHTCQK